MTFDRYQSVASFMLWANHTRLQWLIYEYMMYGTDTARAPFFPWSVRQLRPG